MGLCALGLRCALLLFSALAYSTAGAQKCVPRAIPDMVIDIGRAVALGARFTDPLKAANVEECLSACCRQLEAGGDRPCNLLAFDARRPGEQNCYMFHCPSLAACPLFSSPGVFTYSFWSDPSRPGKHDPDKEKPKSQPSPEKTPDSAHKHPAPLDVSRKKNSSAIASQVSAEHKAKEEKADASKSITSQLLHLADEMDQQLEKMASEDHLQGSPPSSAAAPTVQTPTVPVHRQMKKLPPKPGKAKKKKPEDPHPHRPTEAAKEASATLRRTPPRPSTAAPHPSLRVPPTATLRRMPPRPSTPAPHPSLRVPPTAIHKESGTKNVPSSNVSSTKVAPAPTTAPHIGTRPSPSWTSPWKDKKLSTNDKTPGRVRPETRPPAPEAPAASLEEAPRRGGSAGSGGAVPPPEDKSGLVAALVFGMLFLMVVIGLVSRKVSEARRRHRYTKLDYLINGMYVDT